MEGGKGRGTPLLGCFEKCSAIICSLSRVYKINLGLFAGFVKASGLVKNRPSFTSNARIAYSSVKGRSGERDELCEVISTCLISGATGMRKCGTPQ